MLNDSLSPTVIGRRTDPPVPFLPFRHAPWPRIEPELLTSKHMSHCPSVHYLCLESRINGSVELNGGSLVLRVQLVEKVRRPSMNAGFRIAYLRLGRLPP